jgi:hypothetical protein
MERRLASASASDGIGVLNIAVLDIPTFQTILRSEQKDGAPRSGNVSPVR